MSDAPIHFRSVPSFRLNAGCPIHSAPLPNGWEPHRSLYRSFTTNPGPPPPVPPECRVPHPFGAFAEWVGTTPLALPILLVQQISDRLAPLGIRLGLCFAFLSAQV